MRRPAPMGSKGSPSSMRPSNRRKLARAGSCREALPVCGNRLAIDEVDGQAARKNTDRLLCHDSSHALHCLLGDAGKMRSEDHIVEAEEGMIGRQRLSREHVEGGTAEMSRFECRDEVGLDDDRSARDID